MKYIDGVYYYKSFKKEEVKNLPSVYALVLLALIILSGFNA